MLGYYYSLTLFFYPPFRIMGDRRREITRVSTQRQEFISRFCCWDHLRCRNDLGLCCYSLFCPWCLWAETIDILQQHNHPRASWGCCCCRCCCCENSCCQALSCITVAYTLEGLLQLAFEAVFPFAAPYFVCLCRIQPLVTSRSRSLLGRIHGVDVDRDCCNPICAHFFCFHCALYQEAIFVKHSLKTDFRCCLYRHACRKMCSWCGLDPHPGQFDQSTRRHTHLPLLQTGHRRQQDLQQSVVVVEQPDVYLLSNLNNTS